MDKNEKKQAKRPQQEQTRLIIRVIAAGYLLYTAYLLIYKTIVSGDYTGSPMLYVYIGIGVLFAVAAILLLINCWRVYKAQQEQEREERAAAAAAKNKKDEEWGCRPDEPEQEISHLDD